MDLELKSPGNVNVVIIQVLTLIWSIMMRLVHNVDIILIEIEISNKFINSLSFFINNSWL